ncbi:MAG: helix-turn-helix domain-containing protein [Candidatus Amoebophilus sp.]
MIHRGEIVEKVVRKNGYSLTKLAGKLEISRNTLYNKFQDANLSYRFIGEVGRILHYDVSLDFPEMLKEEFATGKKNNDLISIEIKYSNLLEKHIKLLELLVKVANEAEAYALKQEINKFMDDETV